MKDEILKRLDGLAGALKTTVEFLWATLVRQARVEGALYGLGALACLAGASFILWTLVRLFKRSTPGYVKIWEEEAGGFLAFLLILGLGGNLAGLWGCLYWCLTGLLNPNYWALQKILETLR